MPALNGPEYNAAVEVFRETEYPMIRDSVYLDHAGTTLCAKSVVDSFASEMTSTLFGNPHSASLSSQLSTSRIEDTRMNLLSFLGADPIEYDLVFVPNATAGVKLVVDAMRSQPKGWLYAYHQACHTSIVGAREEALHSLCLNDDTVEAWIDGVDPFKDCPQPRAPTTLFSYSAQSHMDGKRYPLSWSANLKENNSNSDSRIFTLLDASSFSATSRLTLDQPNISPDFIVLSLYKIFGFPDLGALIVRRSAEPIFDSRKYFGGGTVDMVVCGKEQWHAPKSHFLHERLEDGTLPFHSIVALDIAMGVHRKLFGSMDQVTSHTSYLTQRMLRGLHHLRHANGAPVCTIYTGSSSDPESLGTGPAVSFNIKNSMGAWTSLTEFEKLANLKMMHIRTGGLCSPGGIASALGLQPWEMKRNFSAGHRCGAENDTISGKPTGVIRASVGAMSTKSDVDRFVNFVKEFFQETMLPSATKMDIDRPETSSPNNQPSLRVKAITVYPIKSCGGFPIPRGVPWEIRPEGLAWDREWCLIHQGSGYALSQKRCPNMALLKPSLDFEQGLLVVKYLGKPVHGSPTQISIPLSADPSLIDTKFQQIQSRVCGDQISAQMYSSDLINGFFSKSLGVPCILARFPPGGLGASSRFAKAQMQRYQQLNRGQRLPGSFPEIPSPPDSDSEQQQPAKLLLSNESPILMIYSSSVDALNQEIRGRGGNVVADRAFRANIVLQKPDGMKGQPAFAEDGWVSVCIGRQNFKLLGACRRCQMLCVDQETAEKKEEPFITLAKTRRFDGKVYFGVHMRHDPPNKTDYTSKETQYPTIEVGESVTVETRE
ncbi:pyridoxal phosphate-dependent transferase [Dactylonectria macrodidyma]|uniref:Molybdenum cofactor sulfurase n=1 Tax=Dactylonectria macrodidyma TaxID=307937 RepID=A0A9P9FRT0_9HYPO|nr:pyridoxal phosphate-dependent transferase [Dactylonectria macrodidyma]